MGGYLPALNLRLRDKHPIKRIMVVSGQPACRHCMFGTHGEKPETACLDLVEEIFGSFKLSDSSLNLDFPHGCGRYDSIRCGVFNFVA